MKIFTREYVETLVYMFISAFAVGRLVAELALKCESPIVRTMVAAGITAGYACLSERILEMLVDYDITKQSIEDGDFAINQ